MAVYPDGTILSGGYIPATDSVPTVAGEGCIFENVTFVNPAKFGTGCVFVKCIFLDYNSYYNTQPHRTGEGNIFTDCTFNYVIFGENNVSNVSPIGGVRPNQPNASMVFGESSDSTPSVSLVNCLVCGTISVIENGNVMVNNIVNDKEETKGGNVTSSGVCAKCG